MCYPHDALSRKLLTLMEFKSLLHCKHLLRSLKSVGYHEATPIQKQAIPVILQGQDLVGCAQTGTGKTAAFALPVLEQLMAEATPTTGAEKRRQRTGRRAIRALVLAPTRELAVQIRDSFATYGEFTPLRQTVVYGGVGQGPQVKSLRNGIDILIATPGRLLDLIGQGHIDLTAVEILILDEADRMLDMGFIHDLRKIVAHACNRRQTLMFSATMPAEIRKLSEQWLNRPKRIQVTPVASTTENVSQAVYFVERQHKATTLTQFLREKHNSKTLVFSRTKRGADKIARRLQRDGIQAIAIHGDKSQTRRQAAIHEFNSKQPPVLVATDLASRGLDFSGISHVINYDLPDTPETYVHRIGRTARAGATGQAISFCMHDERNRLRLIEKLTGQAVTVEAPLKLSDYRETNSSASQIGTIDTSRTEPSEGVKRSKNGSAQKQQSGQRNRPKGQNSRSRKKNSGQSNNGNGGRRVTKASSSRKKGRTHAEIGR